MARTKNKRKCNKNITYNHRGNFFVDGGETETGAEKTIGGIVQAAQGAVGLADNFMNATKLADTSKEENAMANAGLNTTDNDSFDQLSKDWGATSYIMAPDAKGLRGGNDAMNIFKSTVQGAGAGASFGGVGAIVGAGVGLLSSVGGAFIGGHKARKKIRELNKMADNANVVKANNLINRAENLTANTMSNLEINRYNNAAFGGKLFAPGGTLNTGGMQLPTGASYINNGGTHEENPNEGVLMGYDAQGVPNKVEEGEVIWNDYVFSNRIQIPKNILKDLKLRKGTFADGAKNYGKVIEEQPNDPIAKRTYNSNMEKLREAQEYVKAQREKKAQLDAINNMSDEEKLSLMDAAKQQAVQQQQMQQVSQEEQMIPGENMQAYGGNLYAKGDTLTKFTLAPNDIKKADTDFMKVWSNNVPFTSVSPIGTWSNNTLAQSQITGKPYERLLTKDEIEAFNKSIKQGKKQVKKDLDRIFGRNNGFNTTSLRYAPVVGSAIGAVSSLLSRPNDGGYGHIIFAAKENKAPMVNYTPLGDYMKPEYFDIDYAMNNLNAQSGATRRNILNTAGNRGAAMAGLLAADNNTLSSIGKIRRQAAEYNDAREEKRLTFNRTTNQFNSEQKLKTDMANQSMSNAYNTAYLNAVMQAERLRQAALGTRQASINANLSGLFNNLGNVGRTDYNFNLLNNASAYTDMIDPVTGRTIYKRK